MRHRTNTLLTKQVAHIPGLLKTKEGTNLHIKQKIELLYAPAATHELLLKRIPANETWRENVPRMNENHR